MPIIIHTSDVHLGAPLGWLGPRAPEQQQRRHIVAEHRDPGLGQIVGVEDAVQHVMQQGTPEALSPVGGCNDQVAHIGMAAALQIVEISETGHRPADRPDIRQLAVRHKQVVLGQHAVDDGLAVGDHYAKPGANDRVWNAIEKLALADAEKLLLEVKPHLFAINSDYQPPLRNGDAWMSMCWTGDGKQLNTDIPTMEYVLGVEGGESHSQLPGTATIGTDQCPGSVDGTCQLGWIAADIQATANSEWLEANPAAKSLLEQFQMSVVEV